MEQNFENFIVSDCNNIAYKTCMSFLENPYGKFIALHGPTASGKTHLIAAIQKAYSKIFPSFRVKETTYDEMSSDYMESLNEKNDTNNKFCSNYLDCDLLIVDDMQFIVGKPYTQEEFSNWFLKMLQHKKSVIIAFDGRVENYSKLLNPIRGLCKNFLIAELKEADCSFKEQYLCVILKTLEIDLPDSVFNLLIHDSNIPYYAFYGYISKIQFSQKILKHKLTETDMFELLSDYRHTEI